MSNRLSLGYSSAESFSHTNSNWKNRLRKGGLILCVLIVLGLFFSYMMRSMDSHKVSASTSGQVSVEISK